MEQTKYSRPGIMDQLVTDPSWEAQFRMVYDRAVVSYQEGQRQVEDMFSDEDREFLASIGYTPQELFDFVEDWSEVGEPPFETVLGITAVRREYFSNEQQGKITSSTISMNSLPSMGASLGGFRWLPRIIAKARAKLRGEMPPELMYGCGGDRPFLKKIGIQPDAFLRLVWKAGEDDQKILDAVVKAADASGQ